MAFDIILMNPPYQRNLHLKILAEAIKHLKDKSSVCVNLSPDNWITNPFKMFEKEKLKREAPETIGKHIKEYESYSADDFNNMFGTSNYFGVGIVVVGTEETGFDCNKFNSTNTLLLKVLEKTYKLPSLRSKFSRRVDDLKFVPVRRRTHKTYSYCEMDSKDIDAKDGILFDTEEEALNFKKSIIDTWLYRWLDTTEWDGSENSAEAPFFGDAINPRTGLVGYKGEWTNDDLYKFFNITPEEQKVIEETMEFDIVLMNPPYQRDLHLKILSEAVKHLKDDGVCVNLSPIRWLQDPLAPLKSKSILKKYEHSVAKHIESLDIVEAKSASQMFFTAICIDLGIYVCRRQACFSTYEEARKWRGFDPLHFCLKCLAVCNDSIGKHLVSYKDRTTENFAAAVVIGAAKYRGRQPADCLRRKSYGPYCNGKYNGKTLEETKRSNKRSTCGNVMNWPVACFSTPEECINFFNSTDTLFYKFLSYSFSAGHHVPHNFLPWLDGLHNERTGLDGYKSDWTDEDLFKLFKITPEEKKTIEDAMEKLDENRPIDKKSDRR